MLGILPLRSIVQLDLRRYGSRCRLGEQIDLKAALDEMNVAWYAIKIPGLSADLLKAQIAKWRTPEGGMEKRGTRPL